MIWKILKFIFFKFDPERAHYLSMDLLSIALRIPIISYLLKSSFYFESPALEKKICGLTFKNPIGLAAGFDKDGRWLHLLSALGFGFIEVGTVTPKAQTGNDKPRLFRLIKDKSIINRMGFNNEGVDALVLRLKNFKNKNNIIIGGNIGKNKLTEHYDAIHDYIYCFNALFPYVDYFVVNVSSPNTPNLRALQDKEPLMNLLSAILIENNKKKSLKPVFLKIAPDLNDDQIMDVLDVLNTTNLSGLIINNTTISRPPFLQENNLSKESGGLSGAAIEGLSKDVLHKVMKAKYPNNIISVGGIMSAEIAKERLDMGAHLIQIYTGLIYEGPWFIKKIKKHLMEF